jgi:hypothetical protein
MAERLFIFRKLENYRLGAETLHTSISKITINAMKAITVGLMVILTWVVSLPDVSGDEFEINANLAVRGEYDDNIFWTPRNKESDFILTIKPGLDLIERTERLNLELSGEVAPFFYQDNPDLNEVDQDYRGRIGYRLTERLAGRADAAFIVDHRPRRDIQATGLVQTFNRRDRYYFGAGINHQPSEKAALDVAYYYSRDEWDSEFVGLSDVTRNVADIGLEYNLGKWLELTTGRINIGYADYDYDTSRTRTFSSTVGFQHSLSELFSLRMDGGMRYADSEFDVVEVEFVPPATLRPVTVEENNSGWGLIGHGLLEYRGEKTYGNFDAFRDLAPVSGRLGPTKLTSFISSFYHLFREEMRVGLTAGFYHNKADRGDFSFQEIDVYALGIRPSIRWEFLDDFTLEGAYSYVYRKNRLNDNITRRNNLYLQLSYGLPLFEFLDLSDADYRRIGSGVGPLPRMGRR